MTTTNYFKTALLLGAMTGLILVCGQWLGGRTGVVIALGLAAVLNLSSYWFSDKIVLARYRAKPVAESKAPRLHAMLDRLVGRADLPKPKLFILPEKAPNAFATGRNPAHAAVAVTAGLLETMDQEEVEGVIAHELGHIRNRDILISSVAATIAGAITMLASFARFGAIFGGMGSRDDREGGLLGLLAMAILAPLAAVVIQMAVSRSREYAADATGAEIAGSPHGLARALEKLGRYSRQVPLKASPATSHMFIVMPFGGGGLGKLFSTHPPIEERIRRLVGRVKPPSFEDSGEFKVKDRRHWMQNEERPGDDAEQPREPGAVDGYRLRAEQAEAKLQEYIAAFKQHEREQDEFRTRLTSDVERRVELQFGQLVEGLLETLDHLDLALAHAPDSEESKPLATGVALARDGFLAALAQHGFRSLRPDRETFDPNFAEAIRVDPLDSAELDGCVTETLRPGYAIGERVVRPARVAVGRYDEK